MPSSPDVTEQQLAGAEAELAAMRERQGAVGRRAAFRQHLFMWAGLGSQVALWGVLFR